MPQVARTTNYDRYYRFALRRECTGQGEIIDRDLLLQFVGHGGPNVSQPNTWELKICVLTKFAHCMTFAAHKEMSET